MKGKYYFRVKSKKVFFEFTVKRNITVIKGDSASGKTTLLHMLYEYLRVGKESGYSVSTNAEYYVYLRREVGRDWKDAMFSLENTIIFIEENNEFVFSREFADFVKTSGNYFVLVNRAPFKMLPYSIHEIYEIVTNRKRTDIKESYHELREIYSNYPIIENNKIQHVIAEDSNSGFQFFSSVYKHSHVISAHGNSNILNTIKKINSGDILVIADGAAFGALIESCLKYLKSENSLRITIWLPESFEYLILNSGMIQSEELVKILDSLSDYIDSKEYESWEKYFTELLIAMTSDTPYRYSKHSLDSYYLQEKNIRRIMDQFPVAITQIFKN